MAEQSSVGDCGREGNWEDCREYREAFRPSKPLPLTRLLIVPQFRFREIPFAMRSDCIEIGFMQQFRTLDASA
jgi:hypothetical protein